MRLSHLALAMVVPLTMGLQCRTDATCTAWCADFDCADAGECGYAGACVCYGCVPYYEALDEGVEPPTCSFDTGFGPYLE